MECVVDNRNNRQRQRQGAAAWTQRPCARSQVSSHTTKHFFTAVLLNDPERREASGGGGTVLIWEVREAMAQQGALGDEREKK